MNKISVIHESTIYPVKAVSLSINQSINQSINKFIHQSTWDSFRLLVDGTTLDCMITQNMWGPITFMELVLKDNLFQYIDNHAFLPFSSTLKVLNLGKYNWMLATFVPFSLQKKLHHHTLLFTERNIWMTCFVRSIQLCHSLFIFPPEGIPLPHLAVYRKNYNA